MRRASDLTPSVCLGGCEDIESAKKRLNDGATEMQSMKQDIQELKDGIGELLDILRSAKGFFKVAGVLGKVVGWAATIAAPVLAVYYTFKGGTKP